MECQYCKKEFHSGRSDARFCSNTCRSRHFKGNSNTVKPIQQSLPSVFGLSGNASFDYIFHKTEKENESLKDENRQLRRDLEAEKDKYRELKLQVDTKNKLEQADKALEESKGLGGLVEKITGNERLMGLAEKIILAKIGASEEGTNEDLLDGVEENKMLLQTIVSLVSDKDQEFLAHFVKMTQYFANNPTLLVAASNNLNKVNKINQQTA